MLKEIEIEANKQKFLELLQNVNRDGIDKVIQWITSSHSDFFTAPASAGYHGNYKGGLCEHSLNVYNAAMQMRDNVLSLSKKYAESVSELCPDESIKIAALFHDLCKVNLYETELKFTKDDSNQWRQYEAYTINDKFPMGHGEKSVFMLQKLGLNLTGSEALAIRHHMGIFDAGAVMSDYLKHAYNQTMNTNPLAVILVMADAFASYTMEDMIDRRKIYV